MWRGHYSVVRRAFIVYLDAYFDAFNSVLEHGRPSSHFADGVSEEYVVISCITRGINVEGDDPSGQFGDTVGVLSCGNCVNGIASGGTDEPSVYRETKSIVYAVCCWNRSPRRL